MAATTITTIITLPVATTSVHPPPFPLRLLLRTAGCCNNIKGTSLSSLLSLAGTRKCNLPHIVSCLPPSKPPSTTSFSPPTKLFVSGLSFRTTEESLTNAFEIFGLLLEVNLVMDKIAKRPKGYAFIRYATAEESRKAIEGMHGKFLDGRVIFVEVAKPRSQVRYGLKQNPQ